MANDKRRIYLGSLSFDTEEDSLRELCEKYGTVDDVKVIRDRDTQRSRGFGFVTFENEEDAMACVDAVNGTEWDGRQIKASPATGTSGFRGGSRGGPRGGGFRGSRGGGYRGGYDSQGYGQGGGYGGRSGGGGGGYGNDRRGYRSNDGGSYGGSDGYDSGYKGGRY